VRFLNKTSTIATVARRETTVKAVAEAQLGVAEARDETVSGKPVAQRLNLALACSTDAPGKARQAISELLARSGRTDLRADATVLVSELVTNAVLHAGGPISVSAAYIDSTLRVEVHDTDTHPLPALRRPSASDKTGRGLHLVALLADRWAIVPTPAGKTIWFEIT
jgi:anti-sigma regulatory factor (Ser/Thr protein kinase)